MNQMHEIPNADYWNVDETRFLECITLQYKWNALYSNHNAPVPWNEVSLVDKQRIRKVKCTDPQWIALGFL
uniref:Uncharacterized protein n=1 Tax=Anguilla anguilla TaxID=7936 RepID=A0A0E9PI63_ANGAN